MDERMDEFDKIKKKSLGWHLMQFQTYTIKNVYKNILARTED